MLFFCSESWGFFCGPTSAKNAWHRQVCHESWHDGASGRLSKHCQTSLLDVFRKLLCVRFLAIVEPLRIGKRKWEADASCYHPEKAKLHELHQEEEAPNKRSHIGAPPKDTRVRFTDTAFMGLLEAFLCFNVACESRSLLVFPWVVRFINHNLIAPFVDMAIPSQIDE